ncbi:hypothetical protein METHB2_20134 [Candidatus Methylobacter favarea]|uniref:Bacteriophage T5 Orf172 DNA-binding domain-containing protein n=1 Tax=Candidatus Methylobacter favarea TaxID=2707345 RepID=A0A8S0XI36_9GAMM|nr:hypothetical protein METHB2_20134 [Candidatus Methylobacter favarea]
MSNVLFPPLNPPKIYAYADSRFAGCLKVGYTTKSVQERIAAQYPVLLPNQSYQIELDDCAIRNDGSFFTDHDVHRVLTRKQIQRKNGEWFECSLDAVKAAIVEVKTGKRHEDSRTWKFGMRPEQAAAVDKAMAYFNSFKQDKANKDKTPHFLWNAKMRFGKTFATYQLAKLMGWRKILILYASVRFRIIWVKTKLAALKLKMNGYIPPIGIVWPLMNITTAHGGKRPKNCSMRKMPMKSARGWIISTKPICRSPPMPICIYPVRHFGRFHPVSL